MGEACRKSLPFAFLRLQRKLIPNEILGVPKARAAPLLVSELLVDVVGERVVLGGQQPRGGEAAGAGRFRRKAHRFRREAAALRFGQDPEAGEHAGVLPHLRPGEFDGFFGFIKDGDHGDGPSVFPEKIQLAVRDVLPQNFAVWVFRIPVGKRAFRCGPRDGERRIQLGLSGRVQREWHF